ncbi:MAG: DoxX family protein [Terriglobales bacterium]
MAANFCDRFRPLGLTLLRLAVGVVFLYHGAVKLNALGQWSHNFVHMGFPGWVAYIIGPLEAVGGVLLILGLFSRVFGLLLAGDMLVALLKVGLPGGPITQVTRYGTVMVLSAMAFMIFAYGGGPISLDRLRSRGARGSRTAAEGS